MKIEGHTDNVPVIENPDLNRIDLSGARAGSVADYFIKKGGVHHLTWINVSACGYKACWTQRYCSK